jgi:hypothetical protein
MVRSLGIEVHPLLDDPLPPCGYSGWDPWPPSVSRVVMSNGSCCLGGLRWTKKKIEDR